MISREEKAEILRIVDAQSAVWREACEHGFTAARAHALRELSRQFDKIIERDRAADENQTGTPL